MGIVNGKLVAHTGVVQFPMQKGWKRVHRLVVLPDYQGCGIGTAFINAVAEIYTKQGYRFNLTTTTPALVGALRKSDKWVLLRYGRNKIDYTKMGVTHLNKTISTNRITYSFWFKDGER